MNIMYKMNLYTFERDFYSFDVQIWVYGRKFVLGGTCYARKIKLTFLGNSSRSKEQLQ